MINKNQLTGIIIGIGFVIFGVIKYNLHQVKVDKLLKEYNSKYVVISVNDSINSSIADIFKGDPIFRNSSFFAYVTLRNHQNYQIDALSVSRKNWLTDDLHIGTTIFKEKNNSTILLINNTDTIQYQLVDREGNPITK